MRGLTANERKHFRTNNPNNNRRNTHIQHLPTRTRQAILMEVLANRSIDRKKIMPDFPHNATCENCGRRFNYELVYETLRVSPVLCTPCLYIGEDVTNHTTINVKKKSMKAPLWDNMAR